MTEDTSQQGPRWIWVRNWELHQENHKAGMPWIRLHQSLLHDDDWLDLRPQDAVLLVTIWLLTSTRGNGRVRADLRTIRAQATHRIRRDLSTLERLEQAGFIELRAEKAPRRLEEKRIDRKEKIENGDATPAMPKRAARVAEEEPTPPGLVAHEEFKAEGLPNLNGFAQVTSIDAAISGQRRPLEPHKPLINACTHPDMKPKGAPSNGMQIWKCPNCGLEQADEVRPA